MHYLLLLPQLLIEDGFLKILLSAHEMHYLLLFPLFRSQGLPIIITRGLPLSSFVINFFTILYGSAYRLNFSSVRGLSHCNSELTHLSPFHWQRGTDVFQEASRMLYEFPCKEGLILVKRSSISKVEERDKMAQKSC